MGNFVSTKRLSRMLGCSERAVANWVDRGYIAAHRTPGGHRRIRIADILLFLRQRSIPVPAELGLARSVLVASADQVLLHSLPEGLTASGCGMRVTTAQDIVSALIQMGHEKPGVVVLDLDLPGSNRSELCRRLRGAPALAGVQVIVLEPEAGSDGGPVLSDSEAFAVLGKSVDPAALHAAVTAALESQGPDL